ncbi:CPBP family intramembrane metalloprotease [Paenibacillus sp. P26]|nr:CPBP family intramembrane metalloprotease [Paenibacillus sp. P26]
MKKINFKSFRLRKVNPDELDERFLLVNLYVTQLLVLLVGAVILFSQTEAGGDVLLRACRYDSFVGAAFAVLVLAVDFGISRWVPPEVTDDGGINEMIFGRRPLWHIALLSLIVAFCEESLFRGAIQSFWGPYWTSILFAAIHVRYLQHWLMTGLVFCISYGLGWIYLQTGSIWTPIFAHFLIDFIMGCILRYRREEQ